MVVRTLHGGFVLSGTSMTDGSARWLAFRSGIASHNGHHTSSNGHAANGFANGNGVAHANGNGHSHAQVSGMILLLFAAG